ncbi:MAG: tRNA-dihydrouridine synthase family protein [Patescibacteria group bacterium]
MKNNYLNNKIIALAPMAGYSTSAFRQIVKDFGADLVYSEMVSAKGLINDFKGKNKGKKSISFVKFTDKERPIAIQLFGKEPLEMAEAAKIIIAEFDPEIIDINMGCPARKIISNFNGASLMQDPKLAGEIVREVRKTTQGKILSVKTRLGWENKDEIFEFAKIIERAGADRIAVHCRTKKQGFSGEPDWKIIANLKLAIKIPIFVSGGIKNRFDAIRCLEESNADGILIGQAALSRPWIFKEIKENHDIAFDLKQIIDLAIRHATLDQGYFVELRKQLLLYFAYFKNSSKIRSAICTLNNKEELVDFCKNINANDYDRRDDGGMILPA